MSAKAVTLIGYWNGSTSEPEITFTTKEGTENTWKLVYITLDVVEEPGEPDELANAVKGIEKGMKNLLKSVKNLEKFK